MMRTDRRRTRPCRAWPIFSLSLAGLIGVCAGGVGAAPVLPRGGAVQAGLASIGVASGNSLTVNQSSQRAIINWSSFSIGAGGTVQFNNGSGVTLNRVTGGSVSSIGGVLSATGSVYVLNPAGVIIGKDGLVNVGGGFVASTLGLANASFMAGGPLTFTGSSDASVTNQGRINALGGDVALIGATVRNDGSIEAPEGTAALGAGQSVVLLDSQSDGKLDVLIGGPQTSATNTGLIAAASAELRANGGNIYALAVNTGSRIEATGISATDGNVSLIADGGSVTAQGQITATKADGQGGKVETSGDTVDFTGLQVKANDWLIDPVTLTVDAAAASTIDTNLATTSVTLQTTATSASGPGNQTSGAGDIIIASPITWSSANTFTLDAYHSIAVNADITVAGAGQVVFKTNDGGTGGDYSFAKGDSLSFTGAEGGGQRLTINGAPYTLVYTQADLLNINNNLAGDYALAAPLDFQNGSPPTPEAFSAAPVASLVSTPFTGTFTGLGNAISNFTIAKAVPVLQVNAVDNATYASLGLFGTVGPGGVVRDVGVLNSDVTGTNGMTAGLLVGSLQAGAEVLNSYSSGEVDVGDGVSTSQGFAYAIAGGLVGGGSGQIVNSGSSASVYAGDAFAGGLMGAISAGGAISGSNASGFVSVSGMSSDPAALSAGAIPEGGGLVGLIYGYKPDGVTVDSVTVTNSYATGGVNGGGGSFLGGFVGDLTQGQITNSYATGYINQSAGGQNGEDSLAGGFAGYLAAGAVVSQSWSGGGVNTQGSSGAQIPGQPAGVDYYTFAGGFVGDMDPIAKLPAPTASQDYALGYVSSGGSSYNIIGGFAGAVFGGSTVDHVYATGSVGAPGGVLGGLVGFVGCSCATVSSGSISNSYWDEGTTGQTTGYQIGGTGTATNIVGLGGSTGLSPYASASYANFDLAGTWFLIEGETRPILRSEYSTTITNAHQLQLMTLDPTASYTLFTDIDASETTNPSGVWNTANGFVPVGGNGAANFTGGFDGQGFTISNLTITDTNQTAQTVQGFPSEGAAGLFGVVDTSGRVANVSIANAQVTAGDGMWAGALVGMLAGSVTNASSSGNIATGAGVNTGNGVPAIAGGLVGGVGGPNASVTLSNSSATVTGGDDAFAGGLIGGAAHGATISGSFATGAVSTGNYTDNQQNADAGGFIGVVDGYAIGNTNPLPVTISNSYATGAVTGGSGSEIGGFVGAAQVANISASYATGSVTQTSADTFNLTNDFAGGFVGEANTSVMITGSWSGGSVASVGDTGSQGYAFAGGFVGALGSGASATGDYALGSATVTAGTYNDIGGFVGALAPGGSITAVYATGAVSGPGYVGGLAGNLSGTFSSAYWDEGTTGQTNAYGFSGGTATNLVGIAGSTGLSPYASATYANFDLTNTWFLIQGETRPILRAEYSTTITDAHQLQLMDLNLGAHYILAGSNTAYYQDGYGPTTYINASETSDPASVWNPANGFVPVGATASTPFTGTLDGRDETIFNLAIINTTATSGNNLRGELTNGSVGLFAYVLGDGTGATGKIANLALANVSVTAGDGMWTGALIGDAQGATISNVVSSGSVIAGNTLQNPVNNLTSDAGGLVGYMYNTAVSNSSSSATVGGGNLRAGGLVGSATDSTIFASFATGDVSTGDNLLPASSAASPAAGGLVALFQGSGGTLLSEISGSYATGTVTGGSGAGIGGLVGDVIGANLITTSYATGSVIQTAGGENGIASQAGGFAGYLGGVTLTRDFSTGAVTSVAGPNSNLVTLAGGFAGDVDGANVSDSYATGAVTVSGGTLANVGGFAGMIEESGNINHVYAAGLVSGAQGEAMGGLVGQVGNPLQTDTSGSLTNSVWDTAATGQTAGYTLAGAGTASGVTGLTTAQMQDGVNYATNFPGWDFVNTWSVPSEGYYPELYGVSHVLRININDITYEYGTFPIYSGAFTGIQVGEADSFTWNINNFTLTGATQSTTGYLSAGVIQLTSSGSTASDNAGDYRVIEVGGTLTVTPRPLGVTLGGTAQKVYDGTTVASATGLTYLASGVIGSDVVSLGAPVDASYDTKDAGTGKIVTASNFALSGTDAADYSATAPVSAPIGVITPALLTASLVGTTSKTYDGTTTASLASDNYSLSGVIGDDVVGLNDPTTGAYAGKDVGSYLTVSVSGLALTGASAGDYTVNPSTSGAIGFITPATLTASLAGSVTKTYDQTTAATLTAANYNLSGIIGADTVALNDPTAGAYDTADAGTGKTVSVSGIALTGTDAFDYTVNASASGAVGIINPLAITASLIGWVTKTYDGTTVATLSPGNYNLTGVLGDDSVGLNNPTTGTYDTKDVGTGKTVTVDGLALSGAQALDYTVNVSASAPIGVINPLAITASLTGVVDKTYDGTTAATLGSGEYTLSGVIAGDTVGLTAASGTYDTKNVGTGKTVTFTGLALTGADALDYTVYPATSGAVGQIDSLALGLSVTGVIEKTYDGTTAATLGSNNYSLTGVISGDTVTLIDPTGAAYDTKNVGTGKTVTFTGLALSGADAGNYTVPVSASAPVGVIDALAITASLTGVVDKTYDGTTAATLGSGDYQLTGVIGGDTVALAAGAGTYDTRNVGTGKTVTFSGLNLTGADAMDYTVNTTASAAIGQIDPLALTASLIGAVSKTYDGTVAATLTAANYSLTGVVSGDAASLNDPTTGTYDTSAIGTGKTVTVTGVNLTGADASNYLVPTTLTGPVGVITAAPTIYNPIIPTITPQPELTQTDTTPAGPDNGGGTGGSGGLGGDGATPGTGTGDAVGPASDFSVPVTDTLGGDGSPDQPGVGPDLSLPGGPANSRTQTASVFPVGTEGRGPHTGIDTSPVTGAGNRDLWSGVDESGQACALGGNAAGACQSGPAPSK